jgi:membrane protein required for colicin V production
MNKSMAVVDLLILAAVVVGVTLGAVRGFVPQVTGVFGLGGGLYLASRYHSLVREKLIDPRSEWAYNGEAAFIGIIVLTVVLAAMAGWALRKLMEAAGLATYDRIMGGALGAAKAAATACVVLLAIVYFAPDDGGLERAIGDSRSGPVLWKAMDRVAASLPDTVGDRVEHFLVDHALPEHKVRPPRAPESGLQDVGLEHETIHIFDEPVPEPPVPEQDEPGPDTPLSVDE